MAANDRRLVQRSHDIGDRRYTSRVWDLWADGTAGLVRERLPACELVTICGEGSIHVGGIYPQSLELRGVCNEPIVLQLHRFTDAAGVARYDVSAGVEFGGPALVAVGSEVVGGGLVGPIADPDDPTFGRASLTAAHKAFVVVARELRTTSKMLSASADAEFGPCDCGCGGRSGRGCAVVRCAAELARCAEALAILDEAIATCGPNCNYTGKCNSGNCPGPKWSEHNG